MEALAQAEQAPTQPKEVNAELKKTIKRSILNAELSDKLLSRMHQATHRLKDMNTKDQGRKLQCEKDIIKSNKEELFNYLENQEF